MKRLACVALVAALIVGVSSPNAEEKKNPSIKEIMTKAHKGGDSLIQTVGKELKAKEPDWADVQKKSKELVELGAALSKNNPPKGSKESWEKLTKEYQADAKALEEAAEKKDKEAALGAHKTLSGMCAKCHPAHRGK